jgi:hypothetical protein
MLPRLLDCPCQRGGFSLHGTQPLQRTDRADDAAAEHGREGERSLAIQCHQCRHEVVMNVDHLPGRHVSCGVCVLSGSNAAQIASFDCRSHRSDGGVPEPRRPGRLCLQDHDRHPFWGGGRRYVSSRLDVGQLECDRSQGLRVNFGSVASAPSPSFSRSWVRKCNAAPSAGAGIAEGAATISTDRDRGHAGRNESNCAAA